MSNLVNEKEIDFNDKAIDKLYLAKGNRVTVKFKNISVPYLKGLVLRYSPKTQKKRFYSKYKYKDKTKWLKLNEFILDDYGTVEVSEELLNLYKKYYDRKKGLWRHDPQEQLIIQRELEESQELSVREVIRRIVEAQFPRKTKLGKLAKVSQRTFARFLMGYHKRFDHLVFDEDEKGYGTIKLRGFSDWNSFWAKYPPENKDPKGSAEEISVYDTNNLGPSVIDHLTKGTISKYLECRERSPGTKENLLDALQCLYSYAENKLKCFGDKTPPINPMQNIEILKDDESKFKGSKWNDISFDDDQIPYVQRGLVRLVRKRPFQSEALMLLLCTKFRPEELLKLKKSDLKDGYILFRKETKKDRSKGKNKDENIPINSEMQRVLNRFNRQYKRRCHQKYKFIPWLIPSERVAWKKCSETGYARSNKTRCKSLRGAMEDLIKLLPFGASVKVLRNTFFTQKVELNWRPGAIEKRVFDEKQKKKDVLERP